MLRNNQVQIVETPVSAIHQTPIAPISDQDEQSGGLPSFSLSKDSDRTHLLNELVELGRLMDYRRFLLGARNPDAAIYIRPGMHNWAMYGADLDTARLRAVVSAVKRYYELLREAGLASEPEPQPSEPTPEILALSEYSREHLTYQGPHDQARRASLGKWAEQRGYAACWFSLSHTYRGCHQAGVPTGKEGWTHFLEKAGQYAIYCCFVAALGRHPLEHYLQR